MVLADPVCSQCSVETVRLVPCRWRCSQYALAFAQRRDREVVRYRGPSVIISHISQRVTGSVVTRDAACTRARCRLPGARVHGCYDAPRTYGKRATPPAARCLPPRRRLEPAAGRPTLSHAARMVRVILMVIPRARPCQRHWLRERERERESRERVGHELSLSLSLSLSSLAHCGADNMQPVQL